MKLTIVSRQGKPVAEPVSAVFPTRGGSIGYQAGNTLVLDDQHGTVAGRHATLHRALDGWTIIPEPGATVAVNGHIVSQGVAWPLGVDDVLEIGPYILKPGEPHSAWSGLIPSAAETTLSQPVASPGINPLAAGSPRPAPAEDPLQALSPSPKLGDLQDAKLDPLAWFSAASPASAAAPAGHSQPPLNEPQLNDFDHDRWASDASASDPSSAYPGFAPAQADTAPEFSGHLHIRTEPASAATASSASSASAEAAISNQLLQAFRDGLGLAPGGSDWPDAAFMRLLGATLRALKTQWP